MRIVHLLSQTHLTGAEAHAVSLAETFIDQGHGVFIVSDRLHLKTRAQFISRPIHSARGVGRLREILHLRKLIKTESIDIVHAHSRAAVRIGWWATRGTATALVSTIHGKQHVSWGKKLFDIYGERVVVVCEALKNQLIHDFKMRSQRLMVIGNPVDLPALPTNSSGGEWAKTRSPKDHWLFVTRWTGPKGERAVEFLRDLIPGFLTDFPNLKIDLCGAQPDSGTTAADLLKELANKFPGSFQHRGFVDPLEPEILKYGLVFGGGRVAIAALGACVPCFAFGEVETLGLMNLEKLQRGLTTNFGDMLPLQTSIPLDRNLAQSELNVFLRSPDEPADLSILADKIREHFESTWVAGQILEVYKSARMIKTFRKPIPVLMYHQVVDEPIDTPHRIFVTKETFRQHLTVFKRKGRTTLTFQDLLDFKDGRKALDQFPKKPLILTFDDGYQNNLTTVVPLLREFGFKAVIYLLADTNLNKNTWDAGAAPQVPLMTPSERQELAKSGVFEIGSHGFAHKKLPEMSPSEAKHELENSKKSLEQEFGKPVHSFAFTYGAIDGSSGPLAARAGYRYSLNTDQGGLLIEENPWSIFRVNVFPEDGALAIAKKASSWYRRRYFRRRNR